MDNNIYKAIDKELRKYKYYVAEAANLELDLQQQKDYDTLKAVDTTAENFNASFSTESTTERKIVQLEKEEEELKKRLEFVQYKIQKIENIRKTFNDEQHTFFKWVYLYNYTYEYINDRFYVSFWQLKKNKREIINICYNAHLV